MSRSVCLHDIIITSVSHWSHLHLLLLPCVWHIGCPQSSEQILTTEPQISKISTLYSVLPFQSSMEGNCGAGRRRIRRGGAGEHVSELFLMPGCTFIFQKSQRQFGYKLPAAWTHAHTHTQTYTHIVNSSVTFHTFILSLPDFLWYHSSADTFTQGNYRPGNTRHDWWVQFKLILKVRKNVVHFVQPSFLWLPIITEVRKIWGLKGKKQRSPVAQWMVVSLRSALSTAAAVLIVKLWRVGVKMQGVHFPLEDYQSTEYHQVLLAW